MTYFKTTFVTVCLLVQTSKAYFPKVYPTITVYGPINEDVGVPLILTPLIETNKIDEAIKSAEVSYPSFGNVKSYSGYITVDKIFNSNLFFWFFPSQNNVHEDPVILWLTGGPGVSSLYALFAENGPFEIDNNLNVTFREYTWTKNHSVLYIDNPVGTGFSFTNDGGYAQNETKVGQDLHQALLQFFTMFPKLQNNDFFVAGESYAGKYLPALGYEIFKNNPKINPKINLKGLLIGDGFCDPENQLEYSSFLYQLGLIDLNTKAIYKELEDTVVSKMKEGKLDEAGEIYNTLVDGGDGTLYQNVTGLGSFFNYLAPSEDNDRNNLYGNEYHFLIQDSVRKAIHVGNTSYGYGTSPVAENLDDEMVSVKPWIEELLGHYRILFYNGQLDVVVAYPLTVKMIQGFNFTAAEEYKHAQRKIWYVDDDVAGYCKSAGNLTECLVRNAGHTVPKDQPKNAFDLVFRFVRKTL